MTHSNITSNPATASQWLAQGELLAYPTESVWGLGCDAYNESAVQHILTIKQRPMHKGLIVITDSICRIQSLLDNVPEGNRQHIIDSWQSIEQTKQTAQAHTWLLPLTKHNPVPNWITGQHSSIAVRVIAHPLVQELCRYNVSEHNPYAFIVSTSCNLAGLPPAQNFDEAYSYFSDNMCYLTGETLGYTSPSQIRDGLTKQLIR